MHRHTSILPITPNHIMPCNTPIIYIYIYTHIYILLALLTIETNSSIVTISLDKANLIIQ